MYVGLSTIHKPNNLQSACTKLQNSAFYFLKLYLSPPRSIISVTLSPASATPALPLPATNPQYHEGNERNAHDAVGLIYVLPITTTFGYSTCTSTEYPKPSQFFPCIVVTELFILFSSQKAGTHFRLLPGIHLYILPASFPPL